MILLKDKRAGAPSQVEQAIHSDPRKEKIGETPYCLDVFVGLFSWFNYEDKITMSKKIGVLVGSLRKASYNRKVAEKLVSLAPSSLTFDFIEIGQLPLYNQDLDDENIPPSEWIEFREKIKLCVGILLVTPEYNRSVPAVLKNAIDVGSRPYGQNVWGKKPAGIVSVSPGVIGGFGANHHLRQSLMCLDMPCMQQPEAYMGQAQHFFGENSDKITNESTIKFLQSYINAFGAWVEKQT